MIELIEFLRARLDEDEQAARDALAAAESGWWWTDPESAPERHVSRHGPARTLREVAAKLVIIDAADQATGLDMSVDMDRRIGQRDEATEPYVGDVILRALASVHSDHPDYRAEWAL